MHRYAIVALLGFLVLISAFTRLFAEPAAAQPAAKQAGAGADDDYVLSPMRVQENKGINFLYIETPTTLAQMHDPLRDAMGKFTDAIKAGTVKPAGAPVLIFRGLTQDKNQPFMLDVGFPVSDDAKADGDFQLKKLERFRCATVIFNGPGRQISHAFEKLFTDLFAAGLQPTDETREAILMHEGDDSANDVVMVEAGVK